LGNALADARAREMAWAIANRMKSRGIFNEGAGFKVVERIAKRAPKIISEEIHREIGKLKT
jgi:hypothetical protein